MQDPVDLLFRLFLTSDVLHFFILRDGPMIFPGRFVFISVAVDASQRFLLLRLEVDLLPDQFLEVILYGREFRLHVLEKSFARVVLVGRRPPQVRSCIRKTLLVQGATFLGERVDDMAGFFKTDLFHRVSSKINKALAISPIKSQVV